VLGGGGKDTLTREGGGVGRKGGQGGEGGARGGGWRGGKVGCRVVITDSSCVLITLMGRLRKMLGGGRTSSEKRGEQ